MVCRVPKSDPQIGSQSVGFRFRPPSCTSVFFCISDMEGVFFFFSPRGEPSGGYWMFVSCERHYIFYTGLCILPTAAHTRILYRYNSIDSGSA